MADNSRDQSPLEASRALKRTESAKEVREQERGTSIQESRLKRQSSARGLLGASGMLGASGTMARAATATIGPRRGKTPSKPENPPPSKLNFNAAQQLAILERLESKNYIRGEGLEQFRDEFDLDGKSKSNHPCQQNLSSAFAMLSTQEPVAGSSRGSRETSPEVDLWRTTIEENYSELPSYIKEIDKFLVVQETAHRDLMLHANKKANVDFTNALNPTKLVPLMIKMIKLLRTLEKMMKKPGVDFEILELFKPNFTKNQPGQSSALHCDIRNQTKVVEALKKLPDFLDELNRVREIIEEKTQKPVDCVAKLKTIKEKTDTLEKTLRELNTNVKDQTKLLKKLDELQEDDKDSSTDSLKDFFDGLSDVSSPRSTSTSP